MAKSKELASLKQLSIFTPSSNGWYPPATIKARNLTKNVCS
ncbi:hypothetical protein [Flavobacterium sp.]